MLFTRILKYILPYKRQFIIGSAFALAFSIANGATLYSVVPIFDTLSPGTEKYSIKLSNNEEQALLAGKNVQITEKALYYKAALKSRINNLVRDIPKIDFLTYVCIALFLIICTRILFDMLSVYYMGIAGYGAIRDMRRDLYQSILNLPMGFFHTQKTGGLISKIIYNTDLISGSLSNQLRKAMVNIFIIITHILFLLYINYELTLLSFIVLLLITIPIIVTGRSFRKYTKIEQEKIAEISTIINETIEGIRIIKSYQIENLQVRQFTAQARKLFEKVIKKAMIDIARPHIVEIISSLFLAFLFVYGGGKVLSGEYSKGQFLFFVFTFLFLMNPIKQIANMNNQIKQAEAAGEGIFEIIDREKEYDNTAPGRDTAGTIIPKKHIKFENISFTYPGSGKYALKDINLTAGAGKTTAIVGKSGAGKTTLLDLVPRFIKPSEGKIYIDERDIASIPLNTVRNSIGIVTQEVFLFNGTIADNISYGKDDIPLEKIIDAAKAANAHAFISRLPDGYSTAVGERGIMLSGGERQRVAIARAILRNPPILILDEATSSLDTESERLVQAALGRLMAERTCLVIAHRLTTIINADLILVLEDGKIAEAGTHDELLLKDGIYKKLYDIQFAEEKGQG